MSHSKLPTKTFSSSIKKEKCRKKSHHSWKDSIHFLSRFLAKPHAVGSIWPSSQYLAQAMLQGVFLKPGDVVVEYGPGTGPFTNLLRHYLPMGVEYLGIERDEKLWGNLKTRFPEMHFHHGSAEDAGAILKEYKLKPASLVLSGLPFANMPAVLQERILNATEEILDHEGVFRTFTYLFSSISPRTRHFRNMVSDRFYDHHRKKTVMLNLPPARVLSFSRPVKKVKD